MHSLRPGRAPRGATPASLPVAGPALAWTALPDVPVLLPRGLPCMARCAARRRSCVSGTARCAVSEGVSSWAVRSQAEPAPHCDAQECGQRTVFRACRAGVLRPGARVR